MTAFLRVKEAIKGIDIEYVRVRDIIGYGTLLMEFYHGRILMRNSSLPPSQNAFFVDQGWFCPKRFCDFPAKVTVERQALFSQVHAAALRDKAYDSRNVLTWPCFEAWQAMILVSCTSLSACHPNGLVATRSDDER